MASEWGFETESTSGLEASDVRAFVLAEWLAAGVVLVAALAAVIVRWLI